MSHIVEWAKHHWQELKMPLGVDRLGGIATVDVWGTRQNHHEKSDGGRNATTGLPEK